MPMIGLPDCSSSRVMPQFMYRSMYSAVIPGLSGLSNHAWLRRRLGSSAFMQKSPIVSSWGELAAVDLEHLARDVATHGGRREEQHRPDAFVGPAEPAHRDA